MRKRIRRLTCGFGFVIKHRNFHLLRRQKPQIPRVKKAYRRIFCAGAVPMTQPRSDS